MPWRRESPPTPGFWPGEFHGLYRPWGCKESDTTERLSLSLSLSNGHELEQTLGDSEGQRSLVCCSPWGHDERDTDHQLNKAYSKRTGVLMRRGGQHTDTHKENHVGTQGAGGRRHARERGLRRNQPCPHLDVRDPASRTRRG